MMIHKAREDKKKEDESKDDKKLTMKEMMAEAKKNKEGAAADAK